jgi:hypothetical protein
MKKFATLVSLVLFPFILGTAQVKDTISYTNVFVYNRDVRFGDICATVAEQHTYTLDRSRKLRSFYYGIKKNNIRQTHFFSYNNSGNMYKEIIYNGDKKAIYILKDYDTNGNVVETKGFFLDTKTRLDSNNRKFIYDSKGRIKEELYLDATDNVKLQLRYKYNSSNDVVKTKIKGDAKLSKSDIIVKGKYSYNSSGKKTTEILKVKDNDETITKQRNYFYNEKTALLDSVVIKDKDITYTKKMKYRDNGDIHYFAYFLDGKKVYQKTFNWFTSGKNRDNKIISR